MKTRSAAILATFAAAACGGSGPGSPSPAPLAYSMPEANPLAYTAADTVRIEMNMQGMPIDVTMRSEAVMEATFEAAGSSLEADIRYTSLAGSLANSMGPSISVSDRDMPGTARLRVSPQGDVTVVELPESNEAFRQLLGAESAYRRLFVPLPGRAITVGSMWTDTVTIDENIGSMRNRSTYVIASTLTGDTAVDGRRLLVINSDVTTSTTIAGTSQGVEIRQNLSSSASVVSLWDPDASILFERTETASASGSMDLPAMGMTGLPVSTQSTSVVRLRRN